MASSTRLTKWNVIALRTLSGTSSTSFSLRRGRITSVSPMRWAASTFCLTPPIGSARPCRVTSPVMATVLRIGRPVSRLTIAVVIARPADGPSLGTAPAGTWTWKLWRAACGIDAQLGGVGADVGERDLRRLLHHVTQLAGEGELAVAGRVGGLDEEDVAAGAGHGEPGGHAGHGGALGNLVVELRLAEQLTHLRGVDVQRWRQLAGGDAGGHLAGHLAELALEVAHARLAGVVGDHLEDGLVADAHLVGG